MMLDILQNPKTAVLASSLIFLMTGFSYLRLIGFGMMRIVYLLTNISASMANSWPMNSDKSVSA